MTKNKSTGLGSIEAKTSAIGGALGAILLCLDLLKEQNNASMSDEVRISLIIAIAFVIGCLSLSRGLAKTEVRNEEKE